MRGINKKKSKLFRMNLYLIFVHILSYMNEFGKLVKLKKGAKLKA